ncbi:hypothetical protein HPB52_002262 [Rhipicephalus sanguineus]|uniref:Uncharacterized protein n=1 Tax=Rhipicephalus sanguineus TaxID=34632 RepID=A0A9D4T6K2_RHISA|nr:hypothetical protein HPB52_002262 [Rhipicephalus sanguineus]
MRASTVRLKIPIVSSYERSSLVSAFYSGRPARLHQETHPDWAPTLLLGYTRKSEGIARYERAARRRTKRPTPEVDAGTTAPSRNCGFAATSPENCCDDGDNGTHSEDSPPLLQAECEIQAAENESAAMVPRHFFYHITAVNIRPSKFPE